MKNIAWKLVPSPIEVVLISLQTQKDLELVSRSQFL